VPVWSQASRRIKIASSSLSFVENDDISFMIIILWLLHDLRGIWLREELIVSGWQGRIVS
jgi:hypothetical protein